MAELLIKVEPEFAREFDQKFGNSSNRINCHVAKS
jgi:hypothetical protein